MSGKVDDISLIKVVEEFPILYNKDQSRGQRNAALKDTAWKSVGSILNASERACVTRWKSLRDRFGKELRRLQERPKETTNWALFTQLLFLKDHYKHGSVKDEIIYDIKYQPKTKRHKPNQYINGDDTHRNTEDDLNPDNILINQQLIETVKKHPVIYDKQKIRDSNHLTVKNEAWSLISDILDLPEETCWLRWKKLRDRFAREYRFKKLNPQEHGSWIHYQDLNFLEPHCRKGIPLCVENLKRKNRIRRNNVTKSNEIQDDFAINEDSNIGTETELEFSQIAYDVERESEYMEQVEDENDIVKLEGEYTFEERLESAEIAPNNTKEETNIQDLKEFIIITDKKSIQNKTEFHSKGVKVQSSETTQSSFVCDNINKLQTLIKTMDNVLKEAEDCLKTLESERQARSEELHNSKSKIMEKIQLLLRDLPDDKRNLAEHRIIEFLCESQIKTLNGTAINNSI